MPAKKLLYDEIVRFYQGLAPDFFMPEGVSVMHPYREQEVRKIIRLFYQKYYSDDDSRVILFGINPGRFGAGITGVPFTDPIRLESRCGIANPFQKKPELSSEFVYEVVDAWGGAADFYRHFFVSALSPLGFVRNGKNLNYYDDKDLRAASTPFILDCTRRQKKIFHSSGACICLGEGTNYKYFCKLNEQHHLFNEIIPLPHPRWVMQYRRKRKDEFVRLYVEKLRKAMNSNAKSAI